MELTHGNGNRQYEKPSPPVKVGQPIRVSLPDWSNA
jgi:hypothetical protein